MNISNLTTTEPRQIMNGKPVITIPVKTVINMESGFKPKLLCDGPTFSLGTACVYDCTFCYVPAMMLKSPHLESIRKNGQHHEDVVIRRENALEILRRQLTDSKGRPKYHHPEDTRVIYASPLVDVAGNMELGRETAEACKIILELTCWQIRLLSKSNLLPKVAELIGDHAGAPQRIIYGVSTGTPNDGLAKAFEQGTPLVSKRIQSLHWLQDNGFRTYGMVCPSLPQYSYNQFSREMMAAIRADKCEHIWAEVINLRGRSFTRTVEALIAAGFNDEAERLTEVSSSKASWEEYARMTFYAHEKYAPQDKLRFLQYVTKETQSWWGKQKGVVML